VLLQTSFKKRGVVAWRALRGHRMAGSPTVEGLSVYISTGFQ